MKHRIYSVMLLMSLELLLSSACTTTAQKNKADFLDDYPPQVLGTAHLNVVKRYSDTLIPRDVTFIFVPSINTVKFHHKLLGDNIWIYLKKDNREALRQAIEQYLAAFAEKTLTVEGSKKKGFFGKTEVILEWGLLASAHTALPDMRFDYQFITPNRPYFILANTSVQSEDGTNCPAIRIAISPAQCKDILQMLDEKVLSQIVSGLKADYEKFDGTDEIEYPSSTIENNKDEADIPVKAKDIPFDDF